MDPDSGGPKTCGSGFGSAILARCSLLRVEGFSCNLDVLYEDLGISNLDVLYEGLGIGKLQFLIEKRKKKIFSSIFSFNSWSSKPWIRIRIQIHLKNPDSMKLDPQHCLKSTVRYLLILPSPKGTVVVNLTLPERYGTR
jgi:hypothetical protein